MFKNVVLEDVVLKNVVPEAQDHAQRTQLTRPCNQQKGQPMASRRQLLATATATATATVTTAATRTAPVGPAVAAPAPVACGGTARPAAPRATGKLTLLPRPEGGPA
ncbi:hypothetical protein GCM10023322_54300 [Rugosimonospora acidiphila]|uniref:Uncharacterized protein n=1 Tax=Rugosimonospora acidiphila TaxID=556531 RepID=A0ABP9S9K0_9ACTN